MDLWEETERPLFLSRGHDVWDSSWTGSGWRRRVEGSSGWSCFTLGLRGLEKFSTIVAEEEPCVSLLLGRVVGTEGAIGAWRSYTSSLSSSWSTSRSGRREGCDAIVVVVFDIDVCFARKMDMANEAQGDWKGGVNTEMLETRHPDYLENLLF